MTDPADKPRDVPTIAAMTTDAERMLYYRLAKDCAGKGAVVELGAWMGASTAYIAAGLRDAGGVKKNRVYVYDRWQWNQSAHEKKNGGPLIEANAYRQFKRNLGPLIDYVKPRPGEIGQLSWGDDPVALLIADAPKRVQEISHVLTAFAGALRPGAVMAWQDFAHFPSYQIPACLSRLGEKIEFLAAAVPGTTVAFRVLRPWSKEDVSPDALSLKRWTVNEIVSAWSRWIKILPVEWHARFFCGQAMFLHDIGHIDHACELLTAIARTAPTEVLPKWKYLKEEHKSISTKYFALFHALEREGVL